MKLFNTISKNFMFHFCYVRRFTFEIQSEKEILWEFCYFERDGEKVPFSSIYLILQ